MTCRPNINCTLFNWWVALCLYLARLFTNTTGRQVSIPTRHTQPVKCQGQGQERAALCPFSKGAHPTESSFVRNTAP